MLVNYDVHFAVICLMNVRVCLHVNEVFHVLARLCIHLSDAVCVQGD